MKKTLFTLLIPIIALSSCSLFNSKNEEEKPKDEPTKADLVINYQNIGGAEIPASWNDKDTSETVRHASYTVKEQSFEVDFVGKWRISTNNKELQTKKDPVSFIRSTSEMVVKKMVIEVFSADLELYLSLDHTGEKLVGKETTPKFADGEALEYEVNSPNWSILAKETYKGGAINIYSISLYF